MEPNMKTYLLPLALVSAVSLQACDQKTPTPPPAEKPAATAQAAAPAATDLATTEQRLSYGIACGLGQRMNLVLLSGYGWHWQLVFRPFLSHILHIIERH